MSANGAGLPFLTVGGGIGGLVAAYALARQGFPVTVLEQFAEFREVGAGIQLGPNIFRALEKVGLKNELLIDAWQPGKLEMRDALTGETATTIPLGARFLERFHYPYAVTHRADIHRVYLHACRTHELVTLDPDSRVADFKETDDGVTVWLDEGEQVRGRARSGRKPELRPGKWAWLPLTSPKDFLQARYRSWQAGYLNYRWIN
jgi:3-hydroxybenzoate 6-monooxygenase